MEEHRNETSSENEHQNEETSSELEHQNESSSEMEHQNESSSEMEHQNESSSELEHQNESESVDTSLKEDDDENSISEDRLSCSSSAVSSASDIESAITDFSVEDKNEGGSMSNDQEEQDEDALEPNPGGASALESPPVQTMERPVSPSGYRIPSYVFARNKSTNPEWSAASNESLFSIHTGNMSFTREQFNWLLNPSECTSYVPGDLRKSGELPPPSPQHVSKARTPKQADITKSDERIAQQKEEPQIHTPIPGEEIIAAHFKNSSAAVPPSPPPPPPPPPPLPQKDDDFHVLNQPHVTEASDLVSNKSKKDNAGVEFKEKRSSASTSDDIPLNNCVSHHSDASGQSFAFPVLTEIGRDKSVNSGQSHVRPDLRKHSLAVDQEPNKSPKQTAEQALPSSSWLPSCFSCCSCC